MYFLIYESGKLSEKQAKLLDIISLKFSDLDIAYEKVSVSPLRSADILAKDAIMDGRFKNIIAVGSDKVASQIINTMAKIKHANPNLESWPVFGMIPLSKSKIADVLGLPYDGSICEVITGRKIKDIDLGRADLNYFLTSFRIDLIEKKEDSMWGKFVSYAKSLSNKKMPDIKLTFDNRFNISTKLYSLSMINALDSNENNANLSKISPLDGKLNLILYGGKRSKKDVSLSFFKAKRILFSGRGELCMFCDNQPIKKMPEKFEAVPKFLKVIVGKRRQF